MTMADGGGNLIPNHVAVLVQSFSPSGGLELYTHKVVEGLLDRDIEVTVICQKTPSELSHPKLHRIIFEPVPDGAPKSVRISHHYNKATEAVRALPEHVQLVHSQHLPVELCDVVTFHNHTIKRLISVGHGWEQFFNSMKSEFVPAYRLRANQDEQLCRAASCLVFPAGVMQQDFYDAYKFLQDEKKPYVVAYPGSDLDTSLSAPERAQPSEPFTFLFVGKGGRKKGLQELFKACAILKNEGRKFRLLIAGMPPKAHHKVTLGLMGIDHVVTFLGFRKDMPNVFAQSHAVVIPSRLEPFGMGVLQAAQMGLVPVISSVSGVAEVFDKGRNAVLIDDYLNPHAIAHGMRFLMENPQQFKKMSYGAAQAAREITWTLTTDRTIEAYKVAMQLKNDKKLAKRA